MQPMSLTAEQKTYPITPAKSLVCHTCLGWDKPKKFTRKQIRQIAGTFQNGHRTKAYCREQAIEYLEKHG
jgi:hypothetical protein